MNLKNNILNTKVMQAKKFRQKIDLEFLYFLSKLIIAGIMCKFKGIVKNNTIIP